MKISFGDDSLNLSITGVGLKSDTVGGLGGHPPSLNEADLTDAMVKIVNMANFIIVNTLSMAECNFLFDVEYSTSYILCNCYATMLIRNEFLEMTLMMQHVILCNKSK